ncbi:hypothetical protein Tco_0919807 [Tanacetum coccineum]
MKKEQKKTVEHRWTTFDDDDENCHPNLFADCALVLSGFGSQKDNRSVQASKNRSSTYMLFKNNPLFDYVGLFALVLLYANPLRIEAVQIGCSNKNITFKKQCMRSADLSSTSHTDLQEPVSGIGTSKHQVTSNGHIAANHIAINISENNMSGTVLGNHGVAVQCHMDLRVQQSNGGLSKRGTISARNVSVITLSTNIDEVIAKFARLTPQERAKRWSRCLFDVYILGVNKRFIHRLKNKKKSITRLKKVVMVHDFGFFRFNHAAIKYLSYEDIPLALEAASVGLEIRVIGNDSGEKVFSNMGKNEKELNRHILSRMLTNVKSYTPIVFAPEQWIEVETMLISCNTDVVGSSTTENDKDADTLVTPSAENVKHEASSASDESVLGCKFNVLNKQVFKIRARCFLELYTCKSFHENVTDHTLGLDGKDTVDTEPASAIVRDRDFFKKRFIGFVKF